MTCDDCPGGDDHTHEVNPDWSALDIRIEGSKILFPRPLRPWNVCFDKLANVDTDADPSPAECVAEDGTGLRPMAWDPETCRFVPSEWPAPSVVEWNISNETDPPEDGCEDCGPGLTFAREVTTGCISHVCVDGQWECVSGGSGGAIGETLDRVCYPIDDWEFPVSYGGGQGGWMAYGNDVMDEPCDDALTSYSPTGVEFACWGDSGGSNGPSNGWNSLSWNPDTINNNPDLMSATPSSHGCSRPAFRQNPGLPVGATGPICWTFDFIGSPGNTSMAAYDLVSGQQLPVTIQSAPNCSTAQIITGPNGPQVQTVSSCDGTYELCFTIPSGVQPQNVRFLAWNMGGSNGALEQVLTTDVTAFSGGSDCCFAWNNVTQLAQWLSQNDPGGNSWIAVGDSVCATMIPGIATNYGALSGCDETSDPEVETVTGGGGVLNPCTDCPDEEACTVATPHGTGEPSGVFTDACFVLSINGQEHPEDAGFPAADFPEWWRQPFINGIDGSETWIVMADDNGQLDWHQMA